MDHAEPCVSAEVAKRLGALRRITGITQDELAECLEIHPDTLGERERGTIALRCCDATWQLQNIEGVWDRKGRDFQRDSESLRPIIKACVAAEEDRARAKARSKWSRRKRVLVDAQYQERLKPLRTSVGISRVDLAEYLGVNEKVIWAWESPWRANPAPSRLLAQLEALVALVGSRNESVADEVRELQAAIEDCANGRA